MDDPLRFLTDEPLPEDDFIAIDTETTGPDALRDLPVAVSAVPFVDGRPRPDLGYFTLIRTGRRVRPGARRIHGIDDGLLARAAPPHQALLGLWACRPSARALVGFHVAFDLAALRRLARQAHLPPPDAPALDVAALHRALWPHRPGGSLEAVAAHLGVPVVGRHTATGDAVTAGRLYLRLVPILIERGITTLGAALRLQQEGAALLPAPGNLPAPPGHGAA